MGRTGRPNLIHYAIGHSACPAPSRMFRGAPPAAGPTGTVGRARATPELHGAVRSGTAGCGLNRDHGPCTGRGSNASTHAQLGTAGRETLWGSRAASGPEELRDSEQSHGCRATVCFHYLVPQVTVSDDSTIYFELACSVREYESRRRRNSTSLITPQIARGSR
jgi:hypothetical protein